MNMKLIKGPEEVILADLSDARDHMGTVFFRTDINEPPEPSVKVEQATETILQIRQLQTPQANILSTSHSSIEGGSLKDNFDILKSEIERKLDPISPEITDIIMVDTLEKLKKADQTHTSSVIFLDNVRKAVPEERNPPRDSSQTDLWRLLKGLPKINGALPCCHRDNLSLRVFTDGCFCNDYFIRELEEATQLFAVDEGLKIWGIAGAKSSKLDAILVTENREDVIVGLMGGPVFVLLLWALINEKSSLGRTLPNSIGKANRQLLEDLYSSEWEKAKRKALALAKKIEAQTIQAILPIDVIVQINGRERVVNLKDINKGRLISVGPNTMTMMGNICAKRVFLQNGSVEPRSALANKTESGTFLFMKEMLRNVKTLFVNGGDTVSDVRLLEKELDLPKYRKNGKLREMAVGGFVVQWWNYLSRGGEMPPGIEFAQTGSLRSLYEKFKSEQSFT
ncbi:MAG: phosphoglycerate kinase [Theionarchaea archaeon]|nr:phosphoglycerate kinase [Theionarchaea archaeon]MBU7000507.1 phosphoglycerate kinase [Theionarchaea archaeon]MBU7021550.1 phosphoglycerate kinase [Theionarchaea archaeon]